jgi:glycerophosphoryl diester phosphodiesterase
MEPVVPRSALVAVITFAHRGGRADMPENTIPAFRFALEHGARGLESDAWLSADREVVLVHDDHVRHGLRRIRVERSTAERLGSLDVPRLADLYDACGRDYDLSIDLKSRGVAMPMVEVARERGTPERTWLCSASRSELAEIRPHARDVKLVHSPGRLPVSGNGAERYFADLRAESVDCVNLHQTEWTLGLVELAHRFHLTTFAWDLQETRRILAVLRMGIDGIFSDHVDRMVATTGEWSSESPG